MNKQRQTSNGMIDKLRRVLANWAHSGLFAAFVPLEGFKGTRLEPLYTGDLTTFFNALFIVIAIPVGVAAAALRLAYSGGMNFGKDFWQNKTNLKEMRVEIAIGLFMLLSLVLWVRQINPNMLNLEFFFPKVPEAETVAGQSGSGRGGIAIGGKRLTVSAGECSPNPMFGGYARQMSCICAAESGGTVYRASATDITADGKPFSTGLYQINLTENWVYCPGKAPLDCPSAFLGRNRNAIVRNPDLYNRCVAAANAKECSEATAQRLLNNSKGLDNWSAWKNGNQRTCI